MKVTPPGVKRNTEVSELKEIGYLKRELCVYPTQHRADVLKLQFSFSTTVTRYITVKTKLAAILQIQYQSSQEK